MQQQTLRNNRKIKYFIVDNQLIDNEDYSMQEKMAYLVLLRFAGNGDVAFPSIKTIASKMGCSENTARKALKGLVEKGLITKNFRKKENGDNLSNFYEINDVPNLEDEIEKPNSVESNIIENEKYQEIVDTVKEYTNINVEDAKKINNALEEKNKDIVYLKEKVDFMKNLKTEVKHPISYLIKAIKDDYKESTQSNAFKNNINKSNKDNKFKNFKETITSYTQDELDASIRKSQEKKFGRG